MRKGSVWFSMVGVIEKSGLCDSVSEGLVLVVFLFSRTAHVISTQPIPSMMMSFANIRNGRSETFFLSCLDLPSKSLEA